MKKIALSLIVCALPAFAFAQAPAAPAAAAPAAAPATAAKGDATAGKTKAIAICSGCHGVPGIRTAYPEVYNVPRLGGQNTEYIVSALRSYRAGNRFNQTMKGLASALTEKEILDIAAYYGQK
ncbi:MAG: c-type cytochrome [Betaproteobacteria bacterium]